MKASDIARLRASFPLNDPGALCDALGFDPKERQRQARGVTVRCPRHGGRSCSVTAGSDRTVRVHCFGCDLKGDALSLIAAVRGLDIRRHFPGVLREAAAIGHMPLRYDLCAAARPCVASPPRAYPPVAEIIALWLACVSVTDQQEVRDELERRAIDPDVVDELDLARALPDTVALSRWATFRGGGQRALSWRETGHRLLLPVVDEFGRVRSLRAWRVAEGETPKRLPPSGHRAAGLVLADPFARAMLAAGRSNGPLPVIVAEGEPDFLTWATRFSDANDASSVVLGIVAGAWTSAIADRIPDRSRVIVRTHHDCQGERYAGHIYRSLGHRCTVLRSRPQEEV